MGEERDADTDSRTCTSHDPANDTHSGILITNAGQCRQDNTTIQTEGRIALLQSSRNIAKANRTLQIGEVVTTIPTIGFNVESVTYKNLNFNVWVRFPPVPQHAQISFMHPASFTTIQSRLSHVHD
jgi:hypothetical protein